MGMGESVCDFTAAVAAENGFKQCGVALQFEATFQGKAQKGPPSVVLQEVLSGRRAMADAKSSTVELPTELLMLVTGWPGNLLSVQMCPKQE